MDVITLDNLLEVIFSVKPKKAAPRSKPTKKATGTPSLNSTLNSLASFAADDEDQTATVWDHEKLRVIKFKAKNRNALHNDARVS